jgi:hypothetical protein
MGDLVSTEAWAREALRAAEELGWLDVMQWATGDLRGAAEACREACTMFDLIADHTYIGSTGEVLDALVLPEKNPDVSEVGWFTTRLHPDGPAKPVDASGLWRAAC